MCHLQRDRGSTINPQNFPNLNKIVLSFHSHSTTKIESHSQIIIHFISSMVESWIIHKKSTIYSTSFVRHLESHLWAAGVLRKVGEKKLVETGSHLYILVLNKMWVTWVSGRWDPIIIYSKSEPGLLFVDGLKWKNETPIRGRTKMEKRDSYSRTDGVTNKYTKLGPRVIRSHALQFQSASVSNELVVNDL